MSAPRPRRARPERSALWFVLSLSLLQLAPTAGCSTAGDTSAGVGASSAVADGVIAATQPAATQPAATTLLGAGASLGTSTVAERTIDSVVNISSTKVIRTEGGRQRSPFFNDPFFRHFFGPRRFQEIPRERREKSLGSGVIVSADGVVLTNNHVVEDAAEIRVTLADERELEAEIVGTDPKSDVAVLRLKGDAEDLTPIALGDSTRLRLGEVVLAIGNPFGLGHTVTMGIVSAKGRANVGIVDYEDFIQTDAAINPGNSGGALVNLRGELVGINTAIVSRSGGYQGIGFAIPSNMASGVMQSLLRHGKVVRGWLGVAIQEIDRDLAKAMKLDSVAGVLVSDVQDDSPAEEGGLERGDVILKLNGEQMDSSGRLRNTVAALGAGAEVELELLRDGDTRSVKVTLGQLPDHFGDEAKLDRDQGVLGGLTVAPLSDLTRDKFELPERLKTGVVVTAVEVGSPGERAGFKAGDVILELNRQAISSVEAFTKLYKGARGNLLLLVHRGESTVFMVLRK